MPQRALPRATATLALSPPTSPAETGRLPRVRLLGAPLRRPRTTPCTVTSPSAAAPSQRKRRLPLLLLLPGLFAPLQRLLLQLLLEGLGAWLGQQRPQ